MVWPGWTTCRCVLVSYPSTPIARSPRLASPRFLTRHRRRRDPRRRAAPTPLMAAARRVAGGGGGSLWGPPQPPPSTGGGIPQLPAAAAAPVEGLLDAPFSSSSGGGGGGWPPPPPPLSGTAVLIGYPQVWTSAAIAFLSLLWSSLECSGGGSPMSVAELGHVGAEAIFGSFVFE